MIPVAIVTEMKRMQAEIDEEFRVHGQLTARAEGLVDRIAHYCITHGVSVEEYKQALEVA